MEPTTVSATNSAPNYAAIITSLASIASMASIAFGDPALGAVISDPHTAIAATAVLGGLTALISAFQSPVHALITRIVSIKH